MAIFKFGLIILVQKLKLGLEKLINYPQVTKSNIRY
jgi:hypothetical protein